MAAQCVVDLRLSQIINLAGLWGSDYSYRVLFLTGAPLKNLSASQ